MDVLGSDGWETQAQGQGRDDQCYRCDRGQGGGYGGGYGGGRRRNDDARRGGGGQFPQAAHNPYEVRLPHFLGSWSRSPSVRTKTSIIMVDTRDNRIVSPFLGLVGERDHDELLLVDQCSH